MSYSLAFSQAIVAVLYVADKVEKGMYNFVPTKQLSEELSIAGPTAVKILQNLNKTGIIETREGAKGGVRLAKSPSDITVFDIFGAIENERPAFRLESMARVNGAKPGRAREGISTVLSSAEDAMKEKLKEVTIETLLHRIG